MIPGLLTWEQVDSYTQRAKVPGGWLVKIVEDVMHDREARDGCLQSGWDWRPALAFVPDPEHQWNPSAADVMAAKASS